MVRTAIQLYTLRHIDAPLPDVLDMVGDTSFDGVEFAHRVGNEETDIDAVRDALDRNDLVPAAAHVGLDALEERYDETVELYDRLGCDTLIIPWLDPEVFESAKLISDVATRIGAVRDDLAGDGFRLQYHNHDQEFVPVGDRTGMDELLDSVDDLGFEIDLGWVCVGGDDPVDFVDQYADRISHVHVADADAETASSVELGEGDLDLDAVMAAVERADVDWYVYEHDQPTDPTASLAHGATTLGSLR